MPDHKPQPQRDDRSRNHQPRGGADRNDSRRSGGGGGGGAGTGAGMNSSAGRSASGGSQQPPKGPVNRGMDSQDRNRRDDNRQTGGDRKDPDIEIIEPTKKKFTGRCRLFIGNLPLDMKEADLRKMFEEHGEISECFLSQKGFGFIRMDTRAHAESAKEALDGKLVANRALRIRFAVHGAAIRVKELSPYVSNELLYKAFSQFGHVERAVHIVDEKGRPTGEGIVEYERKPGALEALRRVGEGVFLMTSNPKPVIVEPLEPRDEDDGQQERMIPKNMQMQRELEQPPRFGLPGTFEHEFGNRWKELYQMEKVRREQLEQELREGRERLEADMDVAFQDYQAMLLREDLRRRQEELDRLEAAKRERMEIMRRRDEERASRGGFGHGFHSHGYQGSFNVPPFNAPPPAMGQPEQGLPLQFNDEVGIQQSQQQNERAGSRDSGGAPRGPGDDNLVHGVQKLLQMFKGAPPEAQQLGQVFGTPQTDQQQIQQQQGMPDAFPNQPPPADLFQNQAPVRMFEQNPQEFGHPQKRRRY